MCRIWQLFNLLCVQYQPKFSGLISCTAQKPRDPNLLLHDQRFKRGLQINSRCDHADPASRLPRTTGFELLRYVLETESGNRNARW